MRSEEEHEDDEPMPDLSPGDTPPPDITALPHQDHVWAPGGWYEVLGSVVPRTEVAG